MLVPIRAIVEVDAPLDELDVVQRELRRRPLGLVLVHGLIDEILEVVGLVRIPDDPQVRLHEPDLVDDRREAEERGGRRVDVQLVESERGFGAAAVLHDEAADGHRERVGIHAQRVDRHLALQLAREDLDEIGLRDRRDGEEADEPDCDDDPEDPPADAAGARAPDEISGG